MGSAYLLLFPSLCVAFYLSNLPLYYCILCLYIIKPHEVFKAIHLLLGSLASIVSIRLWLLHSLHHSHLILVFITISVFVLFWKKTSVHYCLDQQIFFTSDLAVVIIKHCWVLVWKNIINFKDTIEQKEN